jgi:hypothetical protein
MVAFFVTLIHVYFHASRSKRIILSENALLKKKNDILLRRFRKKRVYFNIYDKWNGFLRTVKRAAFNNFLLTGKSQVQRILDEYVAFYNCQRPHQGIEQQIPKPGEPEKIVGCCPQECCSG